jgi:hypothetical protein
VTTTDVERSHNVPTANHQVFDLKQVKAKSTVVVTLKGNAANVRLLDNSGYSAFKAGRTSRTGMSGDCFESSAGRLNRLVW